MADPTLKVKIQVDGQDAAAAGVKKVQAATDQAAASAKKGQAATEQMGAAARKTASDQASMTRATNAMTASTQGLSGSLFKLAAQLGVGLGAAALARAFLDSALASESLAMGFKAVTGSISGSREEMAYIRSVAEELGLEINSAARAYLSLTAAVKGTALEGQASRDIFEAVSNAMWRLGKTSADTQGALLAIEQMISKGVVSAEELRGQLAERMPGAFQLAAKAMGTTTQVLNEMLEKGEITAEQMLPKLAAELNKLYSDGSRIGTVTAEWNRFTGELSRAVEEAAAATGVLERLAEALRLGGDSARYWADALHQGTFFPTQGGMTEQFGQFNEQMADIGRRVVDLKEKAAQFSAAMQSAWTASGRELAEKQLAGVRREMELLTAERQRLIQMASADAEVENHVAAARKETIQATKAATKAVTDLVFSSDKALQGWSETDKDLRSNLARLAADMKGAGLNVVITSTYRSGSKGNHGTGDAVDIVVDDWKRATEFWNANSYKYQLEMPVKTERPGDQAGTTYGTGPHWHVQEAQDAEKATRALIKAQNEREAASKKVAAAAEKEAITQRQVNLASIDGAKTIERYLAEQEEQLRVGGLSTEEKIRSAEATKINNMALEYEAKAATAAAAGHNALAEAHKKSAADIRAGTKQAQDNAVAIDKMAASAKAAAPSVAELWNSTVLEMSKSIQTSLTDAFTGLFDGTIKNASSFLESLKKVVIRGLANLASAILMNPINVVINATLVGAAGNAQAGQTTVQSAYNDAGGGWGGVLGAGKYLTGGNSMTAGLAGYFGDAVSKLGLASEGLLTAGSNLAMTSNLMLGAGAVGGALLGNLVFQGKGYSEIGSSIGATAGAVIGSMILPGIGTVIGGLLGGLGGGGLGSLFGDEDPPTPETIYIQQKGGYFETTQEINSNHETLQKVQEAEQALNDLTGALADILGPEAAKVRNERQTVNQSLHPEEIGAWLTEQTKYTVGEMIAASTGAMKDLLYKAWVDSGYDIETILPIAQQAKALLDNLPAITEEMIDAGMNLGDDAEKAALQLLILAGGIENLTASQAAYADLFIGPEERMQNVAKALGEEFEKLNMTLPASRGELRRMVDALDLTNEENVKARLTILGMADTLDEYYLSMESGEEATSGFIFVFEEFIARLKDTEDALSEAKNSYNTLFVTPEDEMARLSLELAKAFEAFGFVLPDTRDGLQSLVDSFDLTTESGRLAYIGVMQLAAELDAFYNSLDDVKDVVDNYLNVVQQYYDLFTDDDQKLADQIQWLADAFEVLGLVLPPTREEFKKLIETLTEEQRRLLAENENILGKLDNYYKEQDRLAEEQRRAEEEARREAEEAQRKAIEDQKQMISEAHNDRLEALNEESQAAQEALQKINGVVSSLKSAIASFRLDKDILDQSTFQASRDQLVAWSKGKGLPEQEALDKTLGGLSSFDKNSYATQADYARDYWTTMGALTELERRGLKQQTAAEKMVDNLQKQIDLENEWYQAEMERMDELVAAVGEIKAAVAPVAAPGTAPPEQQPNAPSTAAQMAELIAEVKSWRESQRMEAVDMATYQKRSADTLRKWDDEGMPDNREGTTYLKVA